MSPEDLSQKLQKEGGKIWDNLKTELPPAYGVMNQDQKRLALFKEYISLLPQKDRVALRLYLSARLDDLERNFCEHSTATVEQWEAKQKQIYSEHLEVM